MSQAWTVAAAKAKFSEVIARAEADGPQLVTCNGKPAAVIVSAEEWERRTAQKGSLVDFFMASPLRGSKLKLGRLKGQMRKAVS